MEQSKTYSLNNGIRLLYVNDKSPVSYLGVAINAGTRDELQNEWGMAHFVEHLLFKGTEKRRSWHIINRLECVGGQLDAYTTKEDTFVYATVATEHTSRALELIADIIFNSTFPENELEKERDVVLDEIQSYNDSPSELIYDDFEQALFPEHTIGRNILGSEKSLDTFSSDMLKAYVNRCYTTDQMVLFYSGELSFEKVKSIAEKYFNVELSVRNYKREDIHEYKTFDKKCNMDTHQAHAIIGTQFKIDSIKDRLAFSLLSNIIGGPYMSSLLNMAIREKNGLAYHVESVITYYSDIAVWNIYYGCDEKNHPKARRLVLKVLSALVASPLNYSKLKMFKAQLKGQVLIANQNRENQILSMAKTCLHGLPLLSDEESLEIINQLTPLDLQGYAAKLFDSQQLSYMTFI